MPETFFTPEEVANSVRVARATVWRWIREGMLKATMLPTGEYRIAKESLEEFITEGANRAKRRGRRPNARS